MTLDVDGLLRRIGTWTFALAAIWAAGLGLWLGGAMALGIAVGATLGYVNLYFAGARCGRSSPTPATTVLHRARNGRCPRDCC
ncbi:MAG: hypothetical protein U0168_14375 [Nannocystaceae bacterium]